MGVEATATTVIGVAIYRDDLKAITIQKPEYTQIEDRWDPLTGVKVAPVEVRYRGYEYCNIDGTDYSLDDDFHELAEKLAEIAGAPIAITTGEDGFSGALVGVAISSCDCYGYGSHFDGPYIISPWSTSTSILTNLQSLFDEATKWKGKLEKLLGVVLSWGLFTHVQVSD